MTKVITKDYLMVTKWVSSIPKTVKVVVADLEYYKFLEATPKSKVGPGGFRNRLRDQGWVLPDFDKRDGLLSLGLSGSRPCTIDHLRGAGILTPCMRVMVREKYRALPMKELIRLLVLSTHYGQYKRFY